METVLNELVDTSSSSSCSDSGSSDEEFFEMIRFLFHKEKKHRVVDFVKDVINNYSEKEFRENCRLSRETANKVIDMFKCSRHFKERIGCGGRVAVSAETQCLAFLWFAGNKDSYREVSNLFNFSLSTSYRILTNFMEFLFDISTEYIKFPRTTNEKEKTSQDFAKIAGFQNVLGCIDGSYIYIRKPAHKIRSTYVNRHGLISITLQAICDANQLFLDVFIGSPSKIHDARIYKLSFISKDIPQICGSQYHILGDAAYPLREYLLTPYKDFGDLTERQIRYNKKHCQTRVKIENSFGLLKQRFRQLTRLDFLTVERMCKFVLSCCVLHNLCIIEGDVWDAVVRSEEEIQEDRTPSNSLSEAVLKHLGQLKRNDIAERL